ncbi:palmitoyltransferase ZDHHC12-like isoform X2 [Impatiens glandulifera]|uniref:palmitoyltransferase ZDHHC12-like isoform X2 n=1 Tax=Impatiens glandulifera TaxID=253017 RepID=UPI001FB07F87|nr:palmitoyltransferase ZDHHC12-like isoform X2 [Impatiens glandulifera]
MSELAAEKGPLVSSETVLRCIVSFLITIVTHLALYMVSHLFPAFSLLSLLPCSAIVLIAVAALGRACKRLLLVRASAPAIVFLNIILIWSVYISQVRKVVSTLSNILINIEFLILVIGLCRIMSIDPGYVSVKSPHNLLENYDDSSSALEPDVENIENSHLKEMMSSSCNKHCEFPCEKGIFLLERVRYCKQCKACVKGFDHHCPAFGNCIGENNHILFIFLLTIFLITEATHAICSFKFTTKMQAQIGIELGQEISMYLVISSMTFSLLQLLWQGPFLVWHIYCICFNIRTDEWINWKNYPEFHQVSQPRSGQPCREMRFINPYDKGILRNVKELFEVKH